MTLLNAAAPVRATPIEHDNVECTVTMSTPFIRTRGAAWTSAPVGVWRVHAEAQFHDFSAVSLDDWETEPDVVTVATVDAHVIDTFPQPSVFHALDPIDQEKATMRERIDDIIDDELLDPVTRVILIDRLEVDERYRGQRLGPHLLTTLIDSVGGLGDLVVLHAMPLQWRDLSTDELGEAKTKARAVYSMGFRTSGDDTSGTTQRFGSCGSDDGCHRAVSRPRM